MTKKKDLLLILLMLTLTFCKKEDPMPHVQDSLYQYYSSKESMMAAIAQEAEKKVSEALTELEKSGKLRSENQRLRQRYFDAIKIQEKAKQEHKYFLMAKNQREHEVRTQYKKVFYADKEWKALSAPPLGNTTEEIRKRTPSTWNSKKRVEEFSSKQISKDAMAPSK